MISTIIIILCVAALILVSLRLRKVISANEELRYSLEVAQAETKSQSAVFEVRLREKEEVINKLKLSLNDSEKTIHTLEERLNQCKQSLAKNASEQEELQATMDKLSQEIKQQLSKNTELEQTIAEQQQIIAKLKSDIERERLSKPCPRSVMQIDGNLITTETAAPVISGSTKIGQEIEPTRTEGTSYPYYMIEQNNTPVVAPIVIQHAPITVGNCRLRELLLDSLRPYPEIELLEAVAVPVRGKAYSFIPGIAIYIKPCELYINVEIDSPYDLIHRRPAHYVGRTDLLRNLYFIESGWAVCHFAEQQVIEQPHEVVATLHRLLAHLSNNEHLILEGEDNLQKLSRWSYSEAQLLEQRNVREQYLSNAGIESSEPDADTYEGDRPGIDILPDRSERIAGMLSDTKGHPLTKVTVRTYSNEYVFETGTWQSETNDFEKGWRVKDLVEKQEVFIPFSDIVAITGMDSMWLYPDYEQTAGPDSEEHVRSLIREAVYTARPIAITYKNNLGETHERDVLYLTNWITNNKTGQDFTYMEALRFIFHSKFMDTNWSYFTGYCTFRHTSRIFQSQNVQRIAVYNCHKCCYSFGAKELWSCLTNGEPNIARLLYSSFDQIKRQSPCCLAAYAYALAMSGMTEEAINCLLTYKKDYRPYPTLDITWQQAIQSDIAEIIEQEGMLSKYEPVVTALQAAGWDIN